ncbi:putative CDP-diacylglycerol--inositol 3-phosphatidyltransferase [Canna indica]|uniref:CDP-diacylglycerol--inositol 3-phosphatidyltransferase n=1 Tax=Canna indica TaxID=4628 RepID=A0AAQ3KUG5_9LILI|nr:putative CDP-diacylglycerol--inositol 3-phosphatidyltransferase [Canna indica]
MARASNKKQLSVYLYIPNIIGYIRVIMNIVAFALCYSNKTLFAILYFISFVCDGLDGWFARKFNQVSTFGAVLDMVTDRVSTACLLVVLSQIYRPSLIFLALLGLDIGSHWLQMYSTFLSGKSSHKDVKDSTNWLFRAYYGNRWFMAFCCVGSEVFAHLLNTCLLFLPMFYFNVSQYTILQVLYILLLLLADENSVNWFDVCVKALGQKSLFSLLFFSTSVGWAIKQVINVIQMKTAADACVYHDMKRST